MAEAIIERAVLVGQPGSMVGIFARPTIDCDRNRPAIIILNTGIVHRIGHHRMYVPMSRMLAESGHMVLRFDFSGIGDSEHRVDDLSPGEAFRIEIADAIDWLEKMHGARRVILLGLCSGADYAVLYGYTDPRVVGLVLMDPAIPATQRYYLQYLWQRAPVIRSWVNILLGRSRIIHMWAGRLSSILGRGPAPSVLNLAIPQMRAHIEEVYRNSVGRGIHILAVFTGGLGTTRQTYREQMIDGFPDVPFGDQLQLEFFHQTDHIFTSESARLRLNQLLMQWLRMTKFR